MDCIDRNKNCRIILNPLYSYKNEVNYMNVQWAKGSKAGNTDLEIPKFGE
jgi:hypothetical protein